MKPKKLASCRSCGKLYDQNVGCLPCEEKRKQKRREYRQRYDEENEEIVKPLKTQKWVDLRKMVIKRDGGICQRCWHKFDRINTSQLEVHHIKSRRDYPELIFDYNNLITVCRDCNYDLGTSNKLDFTPNDSVTDEKTYNI